MVCVEHSFAVIWFYFLFFLHCSLQFIWHKNTNVFAHSDFYIATKMQLNGMSEIGTRLALPKMLISRTKIKSGTILRSLNCMKSRGAIGTPGDAAICLCQTTGIQKIILSVVLA